MPRNTPKRSNRQDIYEFIRDNPGCTRADMLAAHPDITANSVKSHAAALVESGEVVKTSSSPQTHRVAKPNPDSILCQAWIKNRSPENHTPRWY